MGKRVRSRVLPEGRQLVRVVTPLLVTVGQKSQRGVVARKHEVQHPKPLRRMVVGRANDAGKPRVTMAGKRLAFALADGLRVRDEEMCLRVDQSRQAVRSPPAREKVQDTDFSLGLRLRGG